jgi:hypothetical protein
MDDTDEAALETSYWVLAADSDGHVEDPRGEFAHYDAAYSAFEQAVRFVDEMKSSVLDYPLTIDTVQLFKESGRLGLPTLMHIWQRPPWRTEQLLREWSIQQGYGKRQSARKGFLGVSVSVDGLIVADRTKPAETK